MSTINLPRDTTLQQIANALDGTFRLLPASVTVNNGVFTLPYQGTPPSTSAATVLHYNWGTSQGGLSYTVTYANGIATFTLTGTADGTCTGNVSGTVIVGDYSVRVLFQGGLPVKYAPEVRQPTPLSAQVFEWDYTEANTVDLSDYVHPQNVSPQIGYNDEEHLDFDNEIDASLYEVDDNTGALTPLDFVFYLTPVNSFTFTIPANTLESGKKYRIEIQSFTGILGDNPYNNGNIVMTVYEQGAEE